ncbi:MAG: PQQ-dependent sugar dehydrogenase [Spirochaetota bacterium]
MANAQKKKTKTFIVLQKASFPQIIPVDSYKNSVLSLLVFFSLSSGLFQCQDLKSDLIKIFTPKYKTAGKFQQKPRFSDKDRKRNKVSVVLTEVAQAKEPTDIRFFPNDTTIMLILQKKGTIRWHNWVTGKSGVLLNLKVIYASEQGLLGMALHPNFLKNGKVYLNYSIQKNNNDYSRVSEWVLENWQNIEKARFSKEKIIFELKQPYGNHNAGQLAFGSDGMLYIGWGDGGWRGDPESNGQNPKSYLGSMLRIDIDKQENGKNYAIPKDNPKKKNWLPEMWAIGFRNPWRYSFAPDGRLIASDVGQNKWEEVDIVESGRNYGWNTMEGFHCYSPSSNCKKTGLTMPIYEYGHDEGNSITGGYVYTGNRIPKLKGKYIFGDFITGRIWAIAIPDKQEKSKELLALGRWSILISTFGRDHFGELYVADFQKGKIYRLDPAK